MLIEACRRSTNLRPSVAPPTAAAAVVARGYLLTQMNLLNPAVVVEAGAGSPCGESTLCCRIYYERSPKCLQVEPFHRCPWVLVLLVWWPATDGSNCAETNVSQALIIYSVCCTLLSKAPCGVLSASIFNMSGPTGTMKFHHKSCLMPVFVSSPVSTLSLGNSVGR